MNKYYEALQIDLILDKIRFYIYTDAGRKELESVEFYTAYDSFLEQQFILSDAISCFYRFGNLPISNSKSFLSDLKFMQKGGTGTVEAFSQIYNETKMIQKIIKYCDSHISQYKSLKQLTDGLSNLDSVISYIDNVFDIDFLIKDSASDELYSIRKSIKKIQNNLKNIIISEMNKYKSDLTEPSYSIRNNSFVLPVKTSLKAHVNGLIHDVSDSGETTFIEPEKCLISSNELNRLVTCEKDEIVKILVSLSATIGSFADELEKNNSILGKLDLLNAKFQYAKEINGNTIQTVNDSSINIIEGRHPLLDSKTVIANSLKMESYDRQLIISGPNAGGKSVFLKLVGLLILMNQLIIPIPVSEKSTLGFFNHIYIDIGDIQSIQENLSTFSGHILNVTNILNTVNAKDIVLIDELGTGTDPKEGEALAISICKYLRDRGCKSLITSHFDGVKRYAISSKEVICGSMAFDEQTMTPKYKLLLGIPGKSYGISIAKKYGINKEIISNSNNYLNSKKLEGDQDYVSILTDKIHQVKELQEQNQIEAMQLKDKEKEYKIKIDELTKRLTAFNKEMEEEKVKIIEETQEKLDTLKKLLLKNGTIKLNEVIDAQSELDALLNNSITLEKEKESEKIEEDSIIRIGDYVSYDEFNIEGKVISISKKGYGIITDGGKSYTLQKNSIHKTNHISTPNKETQNVSSYDTSIMTTPMSYELNLIGYHVDEALDTLDHYIDAAMLKNKKEIRVIHGFGSGALRTAIHAYLKKNNNVDSYSLGGEFDGGMGSTIIKLK